MGDQGQRGDGSGPRDRDLELRPSVPLVSRKGIPADIGLTIWVAGCLGTTLVFAFQGYYPSLIGPLSNFFSPAFATILFLSALTTFRRYGIGLKTKFQAVWALFTFGAALWIAAETTWSVYYFVLNVSVPFPSLADVFYMGGYFPIAAGLLLYIRTFYTRPSNSRLATTLVLVVGAILLAFGGVVPLELSKNEAFVGVLVDLTYPILDITLFSITVFALAIFAGARVGGWWRMFGFGAALYVVGDENFLYQVAAGTYYNGNYNDLIFLLAYLTFAYAFYLHRKEL